MGEIMAQKKKRLEEILSIQGEVARVISYADYFARKPLFSSLQKSHLNVPQPVKAVASVAARTKPQITFFIVMSLLVFVYDSTRKRVLQDYHSTPGGTSQVKKTFYNSVFCAAWRTAWGSSPRGCERQGRKPSGFLPCCYAGSTVCVIKKERAGRRSSHSFCLRLCQMAIALFTSSVQPVQRPVLRSARGRASKKRSQGRSGGRTQQRSGRRRAHRRYQCADSC